VAGWRSSWGGQQAAYAALLVDLGYEDVTISPDLTDEKEWWRRDGVEDFRPIDIQGAA